MPEEKFNQTKGVNPSTAHQTAWAGKGVRRMSNMPGTRIAMSIEYFRNIRTCRTFIYETFN